MRLLLAGCLTAVALVGAACGGSVESGAGGTDATALAPSDSTAYVGLDTDEGSEQWQQLDELLGRLGIREAVVEELLGELSAEGVDWEEDVRPALGPSTALVFARGNASPVVLTRPDDRDALDALLDRLEPHPATLDMEDGWVAIAEAEDELARFDVVDERGSLAEDEAFTSATGDLPEDAVAVFFHRGGAADAPAAAPPAPYGNALPPGVRSLGGAVDATDDGLHVTGSALSQVEPETYEPTLVDRIPDGVVAALSFQGTADLLESVRGEAGALGPFLPGIEQAIGVRLEELLGLLDGEVALYVRPGIPLPEVTLAVAGDDAQAGATTIERVARRLDGTIERREVDGVEERSVTVQGFTLTWAAFDGTLLVSTGRTAVRDFRADEGKLVDDEAFARAADAAGLDLDEQTAGIVYAEPAQLLPLLNAIPALSGGSDDVPDEAQRAVDALGGLLAHMTVDGGRLRFDAFVGIPDR